MSDTIPLVPGARVLRERGAFEVGLSLGEINLMVTLGARAGQRPDTFRYGLPVETDWLSVLDFYATHLQPRWHRDGTVPERQDTCRLAVWRRRRLLRTRTVAIALFDDPMIGTYTPTPFLALVIGIEPRDDTWAFPEVGILGESP